MPLTRRTARLFLAVGFGLCLAACSETSSRDAEPAAQPADARSPNAAAPGAQPIKTLPIDMEPQQPADLHFERQLQACEQTICKMLPPQPKRMSDYSEALIEGLGLTTDDTLADARRKVQGFYPGMKSVGLGNAAISGTGLLVAQLSPGLNGNLDEYDIVIVTDGSHNGAVVRSWGARIKCAPVSADTPWQTDACG